MENVIDIVANLCDVPAFYPWVTIVYITEKGKLPKTGMYL